MDQFFRKHGQVIPGVLSCFDRMLFRGYLPIMHGAAMADFLSARGVKRWELKSFLLTQGQLPQKAERSSPEATASMQGQASCEVQLAPGPRRRRREGARAPGKVCKSPASARDSSVDTPTGYAAAAASRAILRASYAPRCDFDVHRNDAIPRCVTGMGPGRCRRAARTQHLPRRVPREGAVLRAAVVHSHAARARSGRAARGRRPRCGRAVAVRKSQIDKNRDQLATQSSSSPS